MKVGERFFTCQIQNPNITRMSRDEAAHGGTARWGKARQDGTPTGLFGKKKKRFPPDDRKIPSWASLWNREQNRFYINRQRDKTSGSLPVDKRFIRGTTAARSSWLLTSTLSHFGLCIFFYEWHVRESSKKSELLTVFRTIFEPCFEAEDRR